MQYGATPPIIGEFRPDFREVLYYLYLPISMPGQIGFKLEKRLHPLIDMVKEIQKDEPERFEKEHVYISCKRQFVGPNITANRPGWHSDGFGTDDLNYVWSDCLPTIFNNGPFENIPDDDLAALKAFEEQIDERKSYTFPDFTLVKLDPRHIHRVNIVPQGSPNFMRTFVKVSVSKHQYNLEGNSVNYDLDYNWKRYSREEARNSPHFAGKDFVVEEVT